MSMLSKKITTCMFCGDSVDTCKDEDCEVCQIECANKHVHSSGGCEFCAKIWETSIDLKRSFESLIRKLIVRSPVALALVLQNQDSLQIEAQSSRTSRIYIIRSRRASYMETSILAEKSILSNKAGFQRITQLREMTSAK